MRNNLFLIDQKIRMRLNELHERYPELPSEYHNVSKELNPMKAFLRKLEKLS